jgi:hypothetical protein
MVWVMTILLSAPYDPVNFLASTVSFFPQPLLFLNSFLLSHSLAIDNTITSCLFDVPFILIYLTYITQLFNKYYHPALPFHPRLQATKPFSHPLLSKSSAILLAKPCSISSPGRHYVFWGLQF